MSTRTLIEINHDCLYDIERDPEAFGKALVTALKTGGIHGNLAGWEEPFHMQLELRGAAIKHRRHHSTDCPTGNNSF